MARDTFDDSEVVGFEFKKNRFIFQFAYVLLWVQLFIFSKNNLS